MIVKKKAEKVMKGKVRLSGKKRRKKKIEKENRGEDKEERKPVIVISCAS